MANSRASLASDYLDNFYASLPPRCSQLLKVLKIVCEFIFYNQEGSSYIKRDILLQAFKRCLDEASPTLLL